MQEITQTTGRGAQFSIPISITLHPALVSTHGLAAGAGRAIRGSRAGLTSNAVSLTLSFPPCNNQTLNVHRLWGVQMSNICLFNLLPQHLPCPAPHRPAAANVCPVPAPATLQ